MEDFRQTREGSHPPLQGPHWHRDKDPEPSLPVVPMRLLLQPGGLSVTLSRPDMLVGRHSDADVRLALPDISRRHCRFVFTDNRWQVFDLNSLNGLYVNGERVQQACLAHRDRISIGSLTFEVDLAGEPRPKDGVLRSIADALPSEERRKAS